MKHQGAIMNETDEKSQQKLRFSQHDLYQEEIFTDLRTASIHRFTPVKANGEFDKGRKIIFVGHTRILTPEGPFPIQFPVEAKNLQQAMEKLPEALDQTLEKLAEEAKEARRQEESRIIVPGSPAGEGIITLK
jgi:hypothetical protein